MCVLRKPNDYNFLLYNNSGLERSKFLFTRLGEFVIPLNRQPGRKLAALQIQDCQTGTSTLY
ncbi:hypothetical protein D3C76_649410 [compost metagenome]